MLLGCSWEAVDRIAKRLVDEYLDDARLDSLYRIGVDEISYKRGHHYLTVADHDSGKVVWVSKDRSKEAFESFFEPLGEQRAAALEAITLDGTSVYRSVALDRGSQATRCLDPFHIVKWCNEALDEFYCAQPAPAPEYLGGGQFSPPSGWTGLAFDDESHLGDGGQVTVLPERCCLSRLDIRS